MGEREVGEREELVHNMNEDCFAYVSKFRCGILTDMLCKKGKCSFYQTKEHFIEGAKKYPCDLLRSILKTNGGEKVDW